LATVTAERWPGSFSGTTNFGPIVITSKEPWGQRKIEVELLANPIDFSPVSRIEPVLIVGA
jgi:hypothetical protein